MREYLAALTTIGGHTIFWAIVWFVMISPASRGDDLDLNRLFHESIPDSPFIAVVYRYADATLEHGRDTYGPQQTGIFVSALNRTTLKPIETRPQAPTGIPVASRRALSGKPPVGANPQWDQNLLRLLYFLQGLSAEDRYPEAADAALKWFLTSAQSAETGRLPWGADASWDVINDVAVYGNEDTLHAFSRPWMLWDRCYQLAPDDSKRFALALWTDHHAASRAGNGSQTGDSRQAGFMIRTWADAFAHTNDRAFLTAIDTVLTAYQSKPPFDVTAAEQGTDVWDVGELLSMAIDCDGAARKVPEPLRGRLTAFAARVDAIFWSLSHELQQKRGFVKRVDPGEAKHEFQYTSMWDPTAGRHTTAAVGVMCMSRYENTGRIGYRPLIVAAAEAYLDSLPGEDVDAWPLSFGQAITLELAAFRITARKAFHDRAFELGEISVEEFFGESPLPRASLNSEHYESTTGADTLALALAELHLSTRTITAVRTPANTIDR